MSMTWPQGQICLVLPLAMVNDWQPCVLLSCSERREIPWGGWVCIGRRFVPFQVLVVIYI